MSSDSSLLSVVPVGLDVGSRCVRVATGRSVSIEALMERAAADALNTTGSRSASASTSTSTSTESLEKTAAAAAAADTDDWPKVVVNADGQRWTRAVVARAAASEEEDNLHQNEEHDHLWGDAAAATISSDSSSSGGWIRDLLQQQQQQQQTAGDPEDDDENNNNIASNNNNSHTNSQKWTSAFFSHVMSSHIPQFQLAANNSNSATATSNNTCWAVVVSVPPNSSSSSSSSSSANMNHKNYIPCLTQSIQQALNKTKRRQRKKMPVSSTVVGVISDPVAIALAYSYYQMTTTTTTLEESQVLDNHKNLLILDGGASGFTWTWLQQSPSPVASSASSSTSTKPLYSHLWCTKHSVTTELVSTRALTTAMARHVAEQLEQQHRLPAQSTTRHARAWYKLQHACEQQILSRLLSPPTTTGSSSGGGGGGGGGNQHRNWAVHMDGWYQGLDCHVTMSAPKLDHLLSPIQQQVKRNVHEALGYIQTNLLGSNSANNDIGKEELVTIVLAGSLHAWLKPLVVGVLSQWNAANNNANGVGFQLASVPPQQVPPEEMVAMGCALQAQWILSKAPSSILRSTNMSHPPPLVLHPSIRVLKSPITIAISKTFVTSENHNSNNGNNINNNHEDLVILIGCHETWLPCQLTHPLLSSTSSTTTTTDNEMVTWTLWQILKSEGSGSQRKALAQLELPHQHQNGNIVSLTLLLSEQGTLHMTLSGSDQLVTLTPTMLQNGMDSFNEDDDDDDEEEEEEDDLD